MPNWRDVLFEVTSTQSVDLVRRKYLKCLSGKTGRNTIAYYSCWPYRGNPDTLIREDDMLGFMTAVHKMDRSKGLDLILHTPGGSVDAAEAIIKYLNKLFDGDIRAVIPQLAMSAGTMIACSCREIIMGKQSCLGPIDPQVNGISANGALEEFAKAKEETIKESKSIYIWTAIIGKYKEAFLEECRKAIELANVIVTEGLMRNMFKDEQDAKKRATEVVAYLGNPKKTMSHGRHIMSDECRDIGLKILDLESDNGLQDAVLSVHHSYMHTMNFSDCLKIIENQDGVAYIRKEPKDSNKLVQKNVPPEIPKDVQKNNKPSSSNCE